MLLLYSSSFGCMDSSICWQQSTAALQQDLHFSCDLKSTKVSKSLLPVSVSLAAIWKLKIISQTIAEHYNAMGWLKWNISFVAYIGITEKYKIYTLFFTVVIYTSILPSNRYSMGLYSLRNQCTHSYIRSFVQVKDKCIRRQIQVEILT